MPDKLKLGMIKESLWVERVGDDSRGGRNKMPWRKRETGTDKENENMIPSGNLHVSLYKQFSFSSAN